MLTLTSSHVKGILCTKAVEESMNTTCFSRHSFDSFPRAKTMLSNLFKSFGWMSFSSSGFQCQLELKIWVTCIYKPGHANCLPLHPGAPPCNVDMAAWAPAVVKVACIPEASMSDKYNDHTCGSDVSWSNQRSQRIWLTQAKWQTIYLTEHGVKMTIGHESKKYYRTHAAWGGRNDPFCHPFALPVCSSSRATRSQPDIFDTTAVEGADRQWGPSQATWKKMLLYHVTYISSTVPRTIWFVRLLKILKRHAVLSPEPPKIQASRSLTRPFCKKPSD